MRRDTARRSAAHTISRGSALRDSDSLYKGTGSLSKKKGKNTLGKFTGSLRVKHKQKNPDHVKNLFERSSDKKSTGRVISSSHRSSESYSEDDDDEDDTTEDDIFNVEDDSVNSLDLSNLKTDFLNDTDPISIPSSTSPKLLPSTGSTNLSKKYELRKPSPLSTGRSPTTLSTSGKSDLHTLPSPKKKKVEPIIVDVYTSTEYLQIMSDNNNTNDKNNSTATDTKVTNNQQQEKINNNVNATTTDKNLGSTTKSEFGDKLSKQVLSPLEKSKQKHKNHRKQTIFKGVLASSPISATLDRASHRSRHRRAKNQHKQATEQSLPSSAEPSLPNMTAAHARKGSEEILRDLLNRTLEVLNVDKSTTDEINSLINKSLKDGQKKHDSQRIRSKMQHMHRDLGAFLDAKDDQTQIIRSQAFVRGWLVRRCITTQPRSNFFLYIRQRNNILRDLLDTESSFLKNLDIFIEYYYRPLTTSAYTSTTPLTPSSPVISPNASPSIGNAANINNAKDATGVALTKNDIELLFANVIHVRDQHFKIVQMLSTACRSEQWPFILRENISNSSSSQQHSNRAQKQRTQQQRSYATLRYTYSYFGQLIRNLIHHIIDSECYNEFAARFSAGRNHYNALFNKNIKFKQFISKVHAHLITKEEDDVLLDFKSLMSLPLNRINRYLYFIQKFLESIPTDDMPSNVNSSNAINKSRMIIQSNTITSSGGNTTGATTNSGGAMNNSGGGLKQVSNGSTIVLFKTDLEVLKQARDDVGYLIQFVHECLTQSPDVSKLYEIQDLLVFSDKITGSTSTSSSSSSKKDHHHHHHHYHHPPAHHQQQIIALSTSLIAPGRKFLMEGTVKCVTSTSSSSSSGDTASASQTYHAFLFSDVLILSKAMDPPGGKSGGRVKYSVEEVINVKEVLCSSLKDRPSSTALKNGFKITETISTASSSASSSSTSTSSTSGASSQNADTSKKIYHRFYVDSTQEKVNWITHLQANDTSSAGGSAFKRGASSASMSASQLSAEFLGFLQSRKGFLALLRFASENTDPTFLKKDKIYSHNQLLFWDNVQKWKTSPLKDQSEERSLDIYKTFIAKGAKKGIIVSNEDIRFGLMQTFEQSAGEITSTIFDEVLKCVISEMEHDFFPRFQSQSPDYDKIKQTMETQKWSQ